MIDLFAAAFRFFLQNRRKRSASVFGIDVNAAAENGLVADVAAGKIETALDRQMSFGFDLLGDNFSEDELFGKVLGSNDDAILARGTAGDQR